MKNAVAKIVIFAVVAAMLVAMTACDSGEKSRFEPINKDNSQISDIVGSWNEVSVFPRTVTVNKDGSFSIVDIYGDEDGKGTVKVEYEEHPDGTKSAWYNFYTDDGELWAGFPKDEESEVQNDLYSGQDGEMHFMRDGIDEKITAEDYLHVWSCDRCYITVEKVKKKYIVSVSWSSSASDSSQWTYPCTFDKKTSSLVCKSGAMRAEVSVSSSGKEKLKVVYKDGSGSFRISSGTLRWVDDKENAGQDKYFIRLD